MAKWCQPSKILVGSLDTFKKLHPDIEITTIDVDDDPDLTASMAIRAVPTIIKLEDGEEIARKVGAIDFEQLNMFFNGETDES